MKTTDQIKILEITSNSLGYQRQSVPDSSQLQNKIINETQNLAQSTPNKKYRVRFNLAKKQIINIYKFAADNSIRFQPLAMTTAMISLIIIFSTNQATNLPSKLIEPIDQTTWEELWLMQDELAFAEL